MKTFEVTVKAFATIVVEAEDEEAALEIASDEIHTPWGWDMDETSVDHELIAAESVESAIRHSPYHQWDKKTTPYN